MLQFVQDVPFSMLKRLHVYDNVVTDIYNPDREHAPEEGAELRFQGYEGLYRAQKTFFEDGQWRTPLERVE